MTDLESPAAIDCLLGTTFLLEFELNSFYNRLNSSSRSSQKIPLLTRETSEKGEN